MKRIILITLCMISLLIGGFGCTNTRKENNISPIPITENNKMEKLESVVSKGFEIIKGQTFDVDLENWGKMRLVSGSYKVDDIPKLRLYLVDSNDNIAYTFPEFFGNMWVFYELKAVAFKDVNKDGLKDIIIIADCILGHGENAAIPFPVSSIYFQKGKEFVTIPELDKEIYYAKQNLNIDMILKYVERKKYDWINKNRGHY